MNFYESLTNGVVKEKYVDPQSIVNPVNLFEKLKNINDLSDVELGSILNTSYSIIIDKLTAEKNTENTFLLQQLMQDKRFVIALKNCISVQNLEYSCRVKLNKIIYDYKTQLQFKTDDTIYSLLKELSDIINIVEVSKLQSIGLPRPLITSLSNAAYSSLKKITCIKRVNLILYNYEDEEVLSEQALVDIYAILFGRNVSELFEGVMLDAYPKEILRQAPKKSAEIYYRINLAILDIIEHLSPIEIQYILKQYKQLTDCYYKDNLRFDFNLSSDYHRINTEIENLKYYSNIDI